MSLNYSKILSLINSANISRAKASRIAEMSETGFRMMMDRQTMAVSTLEKLAEYFEKPISYFFDGECNESEEPRPPKYKVGEKGCSQCQEKERIISAQKKTIATQEMLIDQLQGKKMPNGTSG